MANKFRTHYDILYVTQDAPIEVIQAARRVLNLKKHPDKNHDNPKATRITQEINNSYDVLKDPKKRAKYDFEISNRETPYSTHKKVNIMPNSIDNIENINDRVEILVETCRTIEKMLNYLLAMHGEAVPKPRSALMPIHPGVDSFACENSPEKLKSWLM
jgi:DnaJ-class molecular chaperone